MRITVAICTRNRAELLRQTLEQMASVLRVPNELGWELVVVNNGSTDRTDEIIDSFGGRLPIHRIDEPRIGHSHARNAAVRNARGEYILWTDDDVLVAPAWLEEYLAAFERWPKSSLFGGPVAPAFLVEPPLWLTTSWPLVSTAYAIVDLGPSEDPLEMNRLPYGANMAFRLSSQRRFLYDIRFGHGPGGKIGGEETRVMRELLASGESGRWVPGAGLQHLIPADRQTEEYLRSYYRGRGRRMGLEDPAVTGKWNRAYWVLRGLAGSLAFLLGRALFIPELRVRGLRAASIARGLLEERPTASRRAAAGARS
jgi:glucosyl-dolichyl phosphate glucuronosyltransferase